MITKKECQCGCIPLSNQTQVALTEWWYRCSELTKTRQLPS